MARGICGKYRNDNHDRVIREADCNNHNKIQAHIHHNNIHAHLHHQEAISRVYEKTTCFSSFCEQNTETQRPFENEKTPLQGLKYETHSTISITEINI